MTTQLDRRLSPGQMSHPAAVSFVATQPWQCQTSRSTELPEGRPCSPFLRFPKTLSPRRKSEVRLNKSSCKALLLLLLSFLPSYRRHRSVLRHHSPCTGAGHARVSALQALRAVVTFGTVAPSVPTIGNLGIRRAPALEIVASVYSRPAPLVARRQVSTAGRRVCWANESLLA